MRESTYLVFDDYITGTSSSQPVYTDSMHDEVLGSWPGNGAALWVFELPPSAR